MNLEKARAIPGWMNDPELFWLAAHAIPCQNIAEIGCWMGRSTRALADNTNGLVWAFDTWNGSEEHKGDFVGKHPDWVYDAFRANLKDLIPHRVLPFRCTSVESAGHIQAKPIRVQFDLIFIDAAHDYDSITADILAWRPLVRAGGILCGHDHGHPPIERAVRELLSGAGSTVGIWHVTIS